MRIGLYGGCFNPVHEGHLSAARGASDALGLDRLIFIPSGNPPLKGDAGLANGAHRLAMLVRAIADDDRMEASSIEIDRAGPSFTVDTVRALRQSYPADAELFFLLGADCIARLPQWKGVEELHQMLRFVILPRADEVPPQLDERLTRLRLPQVDASSTQIRAIVSAGDRPPASLLPRAVAEYIEAQQLYGWSSEVAYG
jgi:nicotinate-nucleotide adenylyltransferase